MGSWVFWILIRDSAFAHHVTHVLVMNNLLIVWGADEFVGNLISCRILWRESVRWLWYPLPRHDAFCDLESFYYAWIKGLDLGNFVAGSWYGRFETSGHDVKMVKFKMAILKRVVLWFSWIWTQQCRGPLMQQPTTGWPMQEPGSKPVPENFKIPPLLATRPVDNLSLINLFCR